MSDENPIHHEPGSADPAAKLESGKTHAKKAADDLRAAAAAKAAELRATAEAKAHEFQAKAQEIQGKAGQAYDDVRTRAQTLREDGEKYVRENPTRAILTALGVGFVLGLMFRR